MDNLIKATEATDKHIYQLFLKQQNKDYKLIAPEKTECSYDLTQLTDTSKDLIEIKARHKYSFERFDDIEIETYKINDLTIHKAKEGADKVYVCAMYPNDNLIIVIDISNIDYDGDDVVKKYANWHTLYGLKNDKKLKVMLPLKIKQKVDNQLNTKTYQYEFPNLKETYINTFKKYCKKYNVPENIMKEELKAFYRISSSQISFQV